MESNKKSKVRKLPPEEYEARYQEAKARHEKMLANTPELTEEEIQLAIKSRNPKEISIYREMGWSDRGIAEWIYAW